MNRSTANFVHLTAAAVGATGLVYGWMRYVSEPADDFALFNHLRTDEAWVAYGPTYTWGIIEAQRPKAGW